MPKNEITIEPEGVVTLPPELLDAMGVSEGDYILLDATGKELVLRLATPEEVNMYPPCDEDAFDSPAEPV